MVKTMKEKIKVLNNVTHERDIEYEIIYATTNKNFVVAKTDNKHIPYLIYHTHTGKNVPTSFEGTRTQKNAKQLAEELSNKNWFDETGNFVGQSLGEARSWLKTWQPQNKT